jgi:lipoprotein-anchoring transpeptidase ErfK/SrfK
VKKKTVGLISLFFGVLLFINPCFAAYKMDKEDLYRELQEAGYKIVGDADYFGVPCVRIILPENQAIYQVCRNISVLNTHYLEAREAIAVLNGLNMFYPRRNQGQPNETRRETVLIPLDTTTQPKAFPQFEQNFSAYPKMILVDREKQLLAYYEEGQLLACFPVSTGKSGKGTPVMEGWISLRDKDHVSSIYDVMMPFSLRLSGPYFLHAGVMPGQRDSAGCIRMFMENARWLFERVGNSRARFRVS